MDSYRSRPDVVSTKIDEKTSVLLHLEAQQYYSLNETGTRIWDLLTRGHDAQAIAVAMTEDWDVSRGKALRSVRAFLQTLREANLVETTSDGIAGS
ncbi:PqqD family protein [Salinibacter altiplanensis]|uniref:PqqD family protein n=1 Tax=Salinibacter altiplanensis TaxID=1803181 RepID=UPI000C9FC254|nr:PqqD family protein [Salinibacter altiplanensis]